MTQNPGFVQLAVDRIHQENSIRAVRECTAIKRKRSLPRSHLYLLHLADTLFCVPARQVFSQAIFRVKALAPWASQAPILSNENGMSHNGMFHVYNVSQSHMEQLFWYLQEPQGQLLLILLLTIFSLVVQGP